MRTQPFNPNLATNDAAAKATNFMWWVSRNCPGYDYPKKPAHMVRACGGVSLVGCTETRVCSCP